MRLHRLFPVVMLLAVQAQAAQAPVETICSDHPSALTARSGNYVVSGLMERVRMERRWDRAFEFDGSLTSLRIGRDGSVQAVEGWHEGQTLGSEIGHGCLRFTGAWVEFRHELTRDRTVVLERVGPALDQGDEDIPFFDLLFSGCFVEAAGERWCFATHRVTIAGKARVARLHLDRAELPTGGSVLEIEGEPDLWLFAPRSDGWAIHRTTWASAPGWHAPDWNKPWKILRRAP